MQQPTDRQRFWPLPRYCDNLKTSHPLKRLPGWGWGWGGGRGAEAMGGGRVGILSLLRLFRVTGFIAHHIFSYNKISATHDKLVHTLHQIPLALLSTAKKTSPVFLCIPKYICIVSGFWICWNGLETETLITCLVGDNVINSLCQSNWSPAVMLSQLLCSSNKF